MRRRSRIGTASIRRDSFQLPREPIASGILLSENPNRVKRGTARLSYMEGFVAELEHAQATAYAPLTVSTPVRDSRGRRNPRMAPTSYTV